MTLFLGSGNIFDTCDITTQGMDGRDQVSAFSAGDSINFFRYTDGPNFGWIASLNGAQFPPTPPGGWEYIGPAIPVVLNGSVQLTPLGASGKAVEYGPSAFAAYQDVSDTSVLSAGSAVNATPNTSVSLASFVPDLDNVESVTLRIYVTNTGSQSGHNVGFVSGETFHNFTSPAGGWAEHYVTVPATQTIYYANSASAGRTYINVMSYQ